MSLRYQIVLHKSDEGYAVNCPALPGCWSQGETEQEAMQNIRDAIEDYLAAVNESVRGSDVREVEVSVEQMPKIPGVNHLRAVQAFEKAGFKIVRQGKHIVMSDGSHFITIPRHDPVNALTMGGIVKDAGMSVEEFRNLL